MHKATTMYACVRFDPCEISQHLTVAPSLVHTCERGVLKRLIPTSGDVCIQIEGGAIVGCPIGCRTDSQGRDFCLWENTGEKCIQSLRPSPGGMVPARSKRCSFDGFTTPILADNAYDCQVSGGIEQMQEARSFFSLQRVYMRNCLYCCACIHPLVQKFVCR